ncbi:Hypothetical protein SRAE_1000099900 [Strongyloides ratti]|uniref:Uncharacterized protein n=1 Tax=Strongyloides ratti TaxID=34506 RepID=A0A090L5J3_STRRB|nr:Hypothetical protein SRAE_1000099900 [Strongyloides ratti]CEF62729.1 Hypothetical protein SRAE_1000099900 [Strongyloides ratti]
MTILTETTDYNRSKTKISKRTHRGSSMKFEAGLSIVLFFGGIIFSIDIIDKTDSYLRYIVNEIILFNIVIIIYQWVLLFISSVTREKRALFDEENILETYQPRAYTDGHLFVPDPPTPAELEAKNAEDKQKETEKNIFNRMRDNHYENMYQKAMELSMALEAEDKAAKNSTTKLENKNLNKENKKSDQSGSDNDKSPKKMKKESKKSDQSGSDKEKSPKNSNNDNKPRECYYYF